MSSSIAKLTESAMLEGESQIPRLASRAGHEAYRQALRATGGVVVKTSKGTLVERGADGSSKVLKTLQPSKQVKVGLVLRRAGKAAQG